MSAYDPDENAREPYEDEIPMVPFPDRSIPLDQLHYDPELGLHQKSQCEELHGEEPLTEARPATPPASIHSAPYGDQLMQADDARWVAKGL